MPAAATKEPRSHIEPENLYTLLGFQAAAGISDRRIRDGRRAGIDLPVMKVGRRKFVRGADGIEFIERLSKLA